MAHRRSADDLPRGGLRLPLQRRGTTSFLEPGRTPVAFALDLVDKDLALAAELADEVGGAPCQLAANRDVVGAAVAAGYGAADLSAIAEYLRRA